MLATAQVCDVRSVIRQLDPRQAQLSRALVRQPDWPIGEAGERLRWGGYAPSGPLTGLRCQSPVGVFWVGIDNWSALKGALVVDRSDIPETVRLGLMESTLQPLIASLARLAGWPIACQAICSDTALESNDQVLEAPFSWTSQDGQEITTGVVRGSFELLARAARLKEGPAKSVLNPRMPLRMVFEIGECALRMQELRSLRVGDVLRCQIPPVPNNALSATGRFGSNGPLVSVVIHKNQIKLDKAMKVSVANDTDPQVLLDPAEIAQIARPVKFEVGQIEMTVGDLSELRVGQVIELRSGIERSVVNITIDNQLIAKGELVAIGNELAVQLTRVADPSDTPPVE